MPVVLGVSNLTPLVHATTYNISVDVSSPIENKTYFTNDVPLSFNYITNIPDLPNIADYSVVFCYNLDGEPNFDYFGNPVFWGETTRIGQFYQPIPLDYSSSIFVGNGDHSLFVCLTFWITPEGEYQNQFKVNAVSQVVNFTVCSTYPPISEFPSIYIRPDGRVEGTNRIQQQGDVYKFKSDITNKSLVVLRDNVTIDGQNFTLYGNSSLSVGISLSARNNVTIKNVAVTNFQTGINFDNTSHSKVIDSTITTNNWESGIKLINSIGNIISNSAVYSDVNYYSPSVHGIVLENSSNNTISENDVTGSFYKAIYLDLSNNNTLLDNSVTKSQYGIALNFSSNNNLVGNTIFGTVRVISRGVYSDDGTGIWLEHNSTHNQILKNNVENNGEAMRIWDFSSNNMIYENIFMNNTSQISILTRGEPELRYTPIPNSWDNGTIGNYWSAYIGTDSDGDGIGDTPYIIDENNQDNYPIIAMNYFYPPKDDHLNNDWLAEFFSAIVGFVTSTIGIIFLVVTFFIIGLIISLVIFAKRKESYRKSKILDKNAFLFRWERCCWCL